MSPNLLLRCTWEQRWSDYILQLKDRRRRLLLNFLVKAFWLTICSRKQSSYRVGVRTFAIICELPDVISCQFYKFAFGTRAFAVAGPAIWNSLSDHLHDPAVSSEQFRWDLKMYPVADIDWGPLAQRLTFCQEQEQNSVNVASSTLVQPPGTLFRQTFTTLLIRVHSENDSRMYFFDRAYNWLLLALLDESYIGALQISRWSIDWLILSVHWIFEVLAH